VLVLLMGGTVTSEALVANVHIMQDACFAPWLVSLGIACSTLSSALGSIVSAARILQAIARDDLIPYLALFKSVMSLAFHPTLPFYTLLDLTVLTVLT
jgi:amino acid transporter